MAGARDSAAGFEVDSEKGADIRSAVANAVVRGGWGLLELRPIRMSLEDIFLSLTTDENAEAREAALPPEVADAAERSEGGANA